MPEKNREKGLVPSSHIIYAQYVFTFIFNLSGVEHPANTQNQYYINLPK